MSPLSPFCYSLRYLALLCLLLLHFYALVDAAISPRSPSPHCSVSASLFQNTYQLDSWGEDSIRVRISPEDIIDPDIQALLDQPPAHSNTACQVEHTDTGGLRLSNGNLAVTVDSSSQAVTAVRVADGVTLLQSTAPLFDYYDYSSPIYPEPHRLFTALFSYSHANGLVYGLGEHHYGRYDLPYHNWTQLFEFSQTAGTNSDITIPWYISRSGFGFLWNNPGYGYFIINNTGATWYSNATHQIDLFITTYPDTIQPKTESFYPSLMSRFAAATGHSNPMPYWLTGFWQSKDRYRRQDEFVSVAQGYHERDIPVSAIVIDYFHWSQFGDWSFDRTCWPTPDNMTQIISSQYGMKTMVSIWPHVAAVGAHYANMSRAGYFTHDTNGAPHLSDGAPGYIYDALNPDARTYVFNAIMQGYGVFGIRLFWLDCSEPQNSEPGLQWWYGRADREIGMSWPRFHQHTFYDGLLSIGTPLDQIVLLSRSTWVGSVLLNTLVWSGDISPTFDELYRQIKVAQNAALSGIYWWTTDIGGYQYGNLGDPTYQQVILRWFQFEAFLPVFRLHGHREPEMSPEDPLCGFSGGPNEVWTFNYSRQIRDVMALRESIRPYVVALAEHTARTGTPMVRPMFYDFLDAACYDAEDQFMFGPDWLVAPVYQVNATSRQVYLPTLPSGQLWKHQYSALTYLGGYSVTIKVTFDDFPLFHRLNTTQPTAATAVETE